MRAAGITALGEPVEIFEVDELATPAAGEVLIDVVAAGIGNWDELVRIGSWQIGGTGHGRGGCSRRRRPSRPGRQRPHGKPAERFPFRRSLRLRHSTRLLGSR